LILAGSVGHPDGRPTSEVGNIRRALRRLRQLYGHTPAGAFDGPSLKALREQMVRDGLCRTRINKDVARVKRMYRWAVGENLAHAEVYRALAAVEGLRAGRSAAKEMDPVRPVPEAVVEATVPFLLPPVAAMVRLQLLTGMRPGEVIRMRGIDLDMRGKLWRYTPGSDRGPHGAHKNAYRGHNRVILIGPRGQEIVREYLKTDLFAYLFSPRDAIAAFRAELRRQRKSKVPPSQQGRPKQNPKRAPGARYTGSSYATAVADACRKADAAAHAKNPGVPAEEVLIPRWTPNQLRHAKATEIRREAGLDAARVVLGHRTPVVTEVYAELDTAKAAEVMERLG
jgi:integrase